MQKVKTMNFNKELKDRMNYINLVINKFLPSPLGHQSIIMEAMNYSMLAGGKRIRPLLMSEVYKLFGGKGKEIEAFMTAMEMIHTFSLVHDDLPAMDDDEYRRGKKTTHIVYGEALGILAGDALLNYAYEILTKELMSSEEPKVCARAMHVMSSKSGVSGMIGGQVVDITCEGQDVNLDKLKYINKLKTGALIEASMMTGAVLAGAKDCDIIKIEEIGNDIGIAFQIKDDILDVTGKSEKLGKAVLSDDRNNKTTYVTIMGTEKANLKVEKLMYSALTKLESFEYKNEFLNELIINLINREK